MREGGAGSPSGGEDFSLLDVALISCHDESPFTAAESENKQIRGGGGELASKNATVKK